MDDTCLPHEKAIDLPAVVAVAVSFCTVFWWIAQQSDRPGPMLNVLCMHS